MYKLRNCIIENTPTETFPQMVTITKAPKLRSHFVGKRYLDKDRAEIAIELWESERMISSKEKYDMLIDLQNGEPSEKSIYLINQIVKYVTETKI